jgi:hypothetical protein
MAGISTIGLAFYYAFGSDAIDLIATYHGYSRVFLVLMLIAQLTIIWNLATLILLALTRSTQTALLVLWVATAINLIGVVLDFLAGALLAGVTGVILVIYVRYVASQVQINTMASPTFRISDPNVVWRNPDYPRPGPSPYEPFQVVVSIYLTLLAIAGTGLIFNNYVTAARVVVASDRAVRKIRAETYDPTPSAFARRTFAGHDFTVTLTFDPHAHSAVVYYLTPAQSIIPASETDELSLYGLMLRSTRSLQVGISKLTSRPPTARQTPGAGHLPPPPISPAKCGRTYESASHRDALVTHAVVMGSRVAVCQRPGTQTGGGVDDYAYFKSRGVFWEVEVQILGDASPLSTNVPPISSSFIRGLIDSLRVS